jgi:hypothetical protein
MKRPGAVAKRRTADRPDGYASEHRLQTTVSFRSEQTIRIRLGHDSSGAGQILLNGRQWREAEHRLGGRNGAHEKKLSGVPGLKLAMADRKYIPIQ